MAIKNQALIKSIGDLELNIGAKEEKIDELRQELYAIQQKRLLAHEEVDLKNQAIENEVE